MEAEKTCKICGRTLPETEFKMTRWGVRAGVCNKCATDKRVLTLDVKKQQEQKDTQAQLNDARKLRLAEFTPRELMEELARRGYQGKLTYTVTQTIDINNF